MGHWGQFALWNFSLFGCCCSFCRVCACSWPKLKFPLESAILGRFQKFDTFFNSEWKVRKNGIGPIKIREKKLVRDFRVDAFCRLFFSQEACLLAQNGRQKRADAKFKEIFFLRYLHGTKTSLPNFSSWVEKSIGWMDSAKNCGFQGRF